MLDLAPAFTFCVLHLLLAHCFPGSLVTTSLHGTLSQWKPLGAKRLRFLPALPLLVHFAPQSLGLAGFIPGMHAQFYGRVEVCEVPPPFWTRLYFHWF